MMILKRFLWKYEFVDNSCTKGQKQVIAFMHAGMDLWV
jgi:hypothetical protein